MKTVTYGRLYHAVKWWVTLYNWGLPAGVRDNRRAEIQSDLWEQQHDATRAGYSNGEAAWITVHRFVPGIPADLAWRAGTGDTLARGLGFWFALSAIIGFWLAF